MHLHLAVQLRPTGKNINNSTVFVSAPKGEPIWVELEVELEVESIGPCQIVK